MSTEVWLVSYGETDDREMTVDQIATALDQGDITPQTIVWRDGMPAWLQIDKARELQTALKRSRPLAPPRPQGSTPKAAVVAPRTSSRERTMPGIARTNAAAASPPERKRRVTTIGLGASALHGSSATGGPKPYRRLDTPHPPIRRLVAEPPPEFEAETEMAPTPPPVEIRPTQATATSKTPAQKTTTGKPSGNATAAKDGATTKDGATAKADAAAAQTAKNVLGPDDKTEVDIEPSTGELSLETLDSALVQTVPENPSPEALDDGAVESIPPSYAFGIGAADREPALESDPHAADDADEIVDDVSADTPMFPSPPPMPAADADAEPISLDPVSMVAAGARLSSVPTPKEAKPDASTKKNAAPIVATETARSAKDTSDERRGDSLFDELGVKDGPPSDIFGAASSTGSPAPQSAATSTTSPGKKERGSSPLMFFAVAVVCVGAGYWFGTGAAGGDAQTQPTISPAEPAAAHAVADPANVVSQTQAAQPVEATSAEVPPGDTPPAAAVTQPTTAAQSPPAARPMASDPAPTRSVTTTQAATPKKDPASTNPASNAPAAAEPVTPPPAKPAPAPPPSKSDANAPPFDKSAAAAALGRAAAEASACRKDGDPSGVAKVAVTFSSSGRAVRATISGPPFAGTKTGGCIASVMRGARIASFSGDRVTVQKTVVIH